VIDRDFDLDGVGFRDSNWDSDRVGFGLRDWYRDLDRVRVVDTNWDFNRIGSVNGNPDFNRERVRDRDLLQHGIGTVYWHRDLLQHRIGTVYWHRDFLQHRIGISDLHSLLNDLFTGVEPAVPQTTLRGAALRGHRSCLDHILWGEALRNDAGTRDGGQADDVYTQLWEKIRCNKRITTFRKAHKSTQSSFYDLFYTGCGRNKCPHFEKKTF
jgi:hypothetical protein